MTVGSVEFKILNERFCISFSIKTLLPSTHTHMNSRAQAITYAENFQYRTPISNKPDEHCSFLYSAKVVWFVYRLRALFFSIVRFTVFGAKLLLSEIKIKRNIIRFCTYIHIHTYSICIYLVLVFFAYNYSGLIISVEAKASAFTTIHAPTPPPPHPHIHRT